MSRSKEKFEDINRILNGLITKIKKGCDVSNEFGLWNRESKISVFEEIYRKSRRQHNDGVKIQASRVYADSDVKDDTIKSQNLNKNERKQYKK